jgi:hypothetical protein
VYDALRCVSYDLCVIGSGPPASGRRSRPPSSASPCASSSAARGGGRGGHQHRDHPQQGLREAILQRRAVAPHPRRCPPPATSGGPATHPSTSLLGAAARASSRPRSTSSAPPRPTAIALLTGRASSATHTIDVEGEHATRPPSPPSVIVVIAVGTAPTKPAGDRPSTRRHHHLRRAAGLKFLPHSMIVVGGGVIGTEYASMLAPLGVKVTLIEGRPRLLDFVDAEIIEALQYHLRQAAMTLRLGEKVVKDQRVDAPPGARTDQWALHGRGDPRERQDAARRLPALLHRSPGRDRRPQPRAAGLKADEPRTDQGQRATSRRRAPHLRRGRRDRLPRARLDEHGAGRLAACHMFGEAVRNAISKLLPYGIYAIPEISMVGWTEERSPPRAFPTSRASPSTRRSPAASCSATRSACSSS